jgi:hypothetical protein
MRWFARGWCGRRGARRCQLVKTEEYVNMGRETWCGGFDVEV